jgi:hypothetical protein
MQMEKDESMPATKRLAAATVFSIATFLAAGAVSAEQALSVTLHDGVITPQKIEVPAGKKQMLKVTNTGKSAAGLIAMVADGSLAHLSGEPLLRDAFARGEIIAK